jgi:uncharacterized protein (TIGR00369 family)
MVRVLTPIHAISDDSRPYSIFGQRFITTLRPFASASAAASSLRTPSCTSAGCGPSFRKCFIPAVATRWRSSGTAARVRKHFHPRSLRLGGTLSGQTIMALADFGIYVAIVATIGWVPAAVTTNLNINFLKMPAARDLVGEARLLKIGRRLAVAEIDMRYAV